MFWREGVRNCANGSRCHPSLCVWVCRSGRKINTRHWNWFCHLCGECEHVALVFSLCCFASLSTSSLNASWLPPTSLSSHLTIHCFICNRCASEDQTRTNWRKNWQRGTQVEWMSEMPNLWSDATACGYVCEYELNCRGTEGNFICPDVYLLEVDNKISVIRQQSPQDLLIAQGQREKPRGGQGDGVVKR